MKIILFRGGMVGDLIALMIDPSLSISTDTNMYKLKGYSCSASHILDLERTKLKKFWKYNTSWKKTYIEQFLQTDKVVTSHDTDFSLSYVTYTIQIVCSDESLLPLFSERFFNLHSNEVITSVLNDIKSKNDFISDYTQDIISWQQYYKFPHFIDIKNIGNDRFINDVSKIISIPDLKWAKTIYNKWLLKNKIFQ